MKFTFSKFLTLFGVAVVAVIVYSVLFVETCVEKKHEQPCSGWLGQYGGLEKQEQIIPKAYGNIQTLQYTLCENKGDEIIKWTDIRCTSFWGDIWNHIMPRELRSIR